MKMLNDVDGKRKLKNENEHLENGSNKVLDSISGDVLYSVQCTVYTGLMAFVTQ